MARVHLGLVGLVTLSAIAVSCRSVSPTGPSTAAQTGCRSYPSQYQTTTQSGASASVDYTRCTFDKGAATLSCTTGAAEPVARVYPSVADFIAEGETVGQVRASREGTSSAGGLIASGITFSYDGQGRLTRWVRDSLAGKFASRTTYEASAWDERTRPTAIAVTYEMTGSARPADYAGPVTCDISQEFDDTALVGRRGLCAGVQPAAVEVFDRTGFLLTGHYTYANGVTSTVVNSVTQTVSVCR